MNTLKTEKRWCVRDEKKIPYAGIDDRGKSNDKGTWMNYEDAEELFHENSDRFSGLGVYFSEREHDENMLLCGIDIDAIHHDVEHPNPLAEQILDMFQNTYAEESPSGTGYHIICNIDRDLFPYNKENYPFYEKNPNNSIEVYIGMITNRYFTYTGKKLAKHSESVTDQTENVLQLLNKHMLKPKHRQSEAKKERVVHKEHTATEVDLTERLELIRQSTKGELFKKLYDTGDTSDYRSESEADFALLCLLVPWLGGNEALIDEAYRGSALYGKREKWDERRGHSTYGEISIASAINSVDYPYYSDSATGDNITPKDIVRIIQGIWGADNKEKIAVLPFACGLGKSTAISYLIKEVLESDSTDGIIIATDSLERMYNYVAPMNEGLATLREYIDQHSGDISVFDKDTYPREKERQCSCKILILATQRYLHQLTPEDIQAYTNWEKGKRTLILIDENPLYLDYCTLTLTIINGVDEALRSINPRNSDDEQEIDWCIDQWDKVVRFFKDQERRFKRLDEKYYFLNPCQKQMTDDDSRFLRIIHTYSYALFEVGGIRIIHAVQQLLTGWSIVYTRTNNNRTQCCFCLLNDYKINITETGTKVIIMDGTATLSPEYDDECFELVDEEYCRRLLNRLHIHLVNLPTTKGQVDKQDPVKTAKAIRDFTWRKTKGKDARSVVFTYKARKDRDDQLETELKKLFNNEGLPCNVDHFGATHGKNIYNDASFLIQYGLHRYPNICYILYVLRNHDEILSRLSESEDTQELLTLENSFLVESIRSRILLADIEQNFYRGCIRDKANEKDMDYYVFCNLKTSGELAYLMQLRYWPMNASIDSQDTPKEFIIARQKNNPKRPDILRDWLLNLCSPGRVFTYRDIERETGIPVKAISQIRSRHPEIDDIFIQWSTQEDGEYRKPQKYNRTVNRK